MKLRFGSQYFVIVLLIVILYGLSYSRIVSNFRVAPPDRYYWGAVNYPIDTVGNLSIIREGYNGHWMRYSHYTSVIPSKPVALKMEYILIGQIARVTRLNPLVAFYLATFLLSLTLISLTVFLTRQLFTDTRLGLVALILTFFATGISVFLDSRDIWWRIMSDSMVFQRMTSAMPHYLIGQITLLLSLWLLGRAVDTRKLSLGVAAGATGFVSSWVFLPGMVVMYIAILLFIVLSWVAYGRGKLRGFFWRIGPLILYLGISVLPVFYIRYAAQFYDWNTFVNTEKLFPVHLSVFEYLVAVGMVYPLALVGALRVIKERIGTSFLGILGAYTIVHPVGVFVLAPLFGFNQIRVFQSIYALAFGILATVGLWAIAQRLRKFPGVLSMKNFYILSVGVILVSGIGTYRLSRTYSEACFCLKPGYDYAYPKREVMDAVFWLRDHTGEKDTVLVDTFGGMLIPAFAGNRVYTSWWVELIGVPEL